VPTTPRRKAVVKSFWEEGPAVGRDTAIRTPTTILRPNLNSGGKDYSYRTECESENGISPFAIIKHHLGRRGTGRGGKKKICADGGSRSAPEG